MPLKTCARCGAEWEAEDSEPFITCPSCRLPDRPTRKSKRGCSRYSKVGNPDHIEGSRADPSPWQEQNVRHLEDG